MHNKIFKVIFIGLLILPLVGFSKTQSVETIVVIRHAEKSAADLGQLSCQGLNRSLMLPHYFNQNLPKADYFFAPNPSVKNGGYSYVRPLATIEPTAIRLDLPVDTQIGYNQPDKLMQELLQEKYHHAVVYVAWEHKNIITLAHLMQKQFKSQFDVPKWRGDNYGMVFLFTIDWSEKPAKLHFSVKNEGFDQISATCPRL